MAPREAGSKGGPGRDLQEGDHEAALRQVGSQQLLQEAVQPQPPLVQEGWVGGGAAPKGGSPAFGVAGGQPPTNIRQGCSSTLAKLYTLNRHFTHSYIVIELNVTLLPTLLKFKSKVITIKPFLKKNDL